MIKNQNTLERYSSEVDLEYQAELLEIEGEDSNNIEVKKTKLSTTSKLELKDNEGTLLFCISIDGSSHSEAAFDLVTKEFLTKNSRLLVVHVYNNKLDHLNNYRNKKETIINNYSIKITKYGNNANFIVEDRNSKSIHALEQVNNVSRHFNSNYLISGYFGIKGPKGDNNELSKGVNYLLGNSKIPTIIVKDAVMRDSKSSKGYSWLIVLDKQHSNVTKCLEAFLPLINPEKDFVFGLTLIESNSYTLIDDIKESFMKLIDQAGIKQFDYDSAVYYKNSSTVISERVNFGTTQFDFLVIYNNREKHKADGNSSDVINIVKSCNCSICFYSY